MIYMIFLQQLTFFEKTSPFPSKMDVSHGSTSFWQAYKTARWLGIPASTPLPPRPSHVNDFACLLPERTCPTFWKHLTTPPYSSPAPGVSLEGGFLFLTAVLTRLFSSKTGEWVSKHPVFHQTGPDRGQAESPRTKWGYSVNNADFFILSKLFDYHR